MKIIRKQMYSWTRFIVSFSANKTNQAKHTCDKHQGISWYVSFKDEI